ncbi:cytochrome B [Aquipseudomonas alcaligenes]|jgi:superoxide oxidase|uniref:Cytochrome B n=1 Tax=Aquipseudomonas alcaligenes TaxID=43263 RepID=A0A2V4M1Q6_AQUAC|nr:cytochrome b [Pseudomonas alcaligenes]PYC27327.1 cytochrome B [Pseudomonas alcaligenes]
MSWKNDERRYGSLSIALHWLMLVMIATVYFTMEFRGLFPKGSDGRELMKQTHFILGLSIFFLVWLRLLARLIAPTPKIVPAIPAWQAIPAKLMHLALYGLMICTPLLGWLILSAFAKPIPFFGLELPPLMEPNHDLGEQLEHWHGQIAEAGYWLIGLHAAAGLFHHYVSRDNTLTRILPGR